MLKLLPGQGISSIELIVVKDDGDNFKLLRDGVVRRLKWGEGNMTDVVSADGSYIVLGNIKFQSLYEEIIKNNISYYMIRSYNETKDAHAMGLVINISMKTIEIYDPNGITPNTKHVYYWIKMFIEYVKTKGLDMFERIISADMPYCPQSLVLYSSFMKDGILNDYNGKPTCISWTFYFLWLKSINPGVNMVDLMNYTSSIDPDEMIKILRKVSNFVFYGCGQNP